MNGAEDELGWLVILWKPCDEGVDEMDEGVVEEVRLASGSLPNRLPAMVQAEVRLS